MAKKPAFNGTNTEIRKLYQEHLDKGGTTKEFNEQFSSITVNGRPAKMRLAGQGAIKVDYKDISGRTKTDRKEQLAAQSHGQQNFPKTKGKKDHHIHPPGLYDTFYKGLDEEEAAELARYQAEDLMRPGGNKDTNAAVLNDWEHDNAYHNWDRKHAGTKPGQQMTREQGKFIVPEGATLDERKTMLKIFIEEGPQSAMNEALFSARMVSQHPDSEYWAKEFTKHYDVGYGKGKVKPPPNMSPEMVKKLGIKPPSGGRRAMKALATTGLVAPGALGTAASAAETGMRIDQAQDTNNPVDWLQAIISGASLGADAISAEPVSALADVTNMKIDDFRDPELAAESRAQYNEDYQQGSTQMTEQGMGVSQGNAPMENPLETVQGAFDNLKDKGIGALNWVQSQFQKKRAEANPITLTGNQF